jgi:tetratricopeptide (TPR) repeat protein
MDCRKCLVLALGLMTVAGCTRHLTTGQQEESLVHYDPPPPSGSPFRAGNDNPKPFTKPGTWLARGEFMMQEAAHLDAGPIQDKGREAARQAYLQALRVDPNYLPAHVALARLHGTLEEYDKAAGYYRKVLEVEPNNHPIWYELGMNQARKKDWDNALVSLGKAVELDPENKQYNNMLGFTLARTGQYDRSLSVFAKLQGEAAAHYNLARMLQHMKQTELCKQHLLLALAQKQDFDQARALLAQLEAPAEAVPSTAPGVPAALADPISPVQPAAPQVTVTPLPPARIQPVNYSTQEASPTPEVRPSGAPAVLKIAEVSGAPAAPTSNAVILPPPPELTVFTPLIRADK